MTEIAIRQPAEVATASDAADLDSWVTVVQEISKLASVICDTDFVPKNYRGNPAAATAAILTGRELGLPPMTSLRHVQVVEGSPSLSAEYKRARVLGAGHEFNVLVRTATLCKVSGRRRGSTRPPVEFEYSIEDARTAKLVKDRGSYYTRPRRMLFARASTDLCDALFPDVTNGLPTTELLEQDDDGASGYDEQPARPSGRVTAADITARPSAPQNASPAVRQVAPVPADPAVPPAEPAGEASDDTDHDTPGTVTRPQLTKLGATFTDLGFTSKEREQRLVAASQIIGRDVESSSDLSLNEARKLIDTLDGLGGSREKLIALLAAGEVTGDE